MGFKRLKEDERALVFNRHGTGTVISGPTRFFLRPRWKFEYLPRHVASQDEYLVVQHRSGLKEHRVGPVEMFLNRLEVDSVAVKSSIKIDSNHMVVVYKQLEGVIDRRIVQGPTMFMPSAYEWLHKFSWHGSDRSNPGRYITGKNKFFQLRHVPSHLYVMARDVRTCDISVLTVKLMIFFHLGDVERMLTYTHDPIADFINSIQADIVAFSSQRTYEDFIRQTNDLNSLDCYPQLLDRAKHIGYNITKVVYRGYIASPSLQATHDNAVNTRMSLKLDAESEEQEQALKEFRLKREKERTKLKHEMEGKLQEHKQELERMKKGIVLDKKKLLQETDLKKKVKEVELRAELEKQQNKQKQELLSKLVSQGLDATRYVVAMQPEFTADDEVIVSQPGPPQAKAITTI